MIASYQLGINPFGATDFARVKERSQQLCWRLGTDCGTISEQAPRASQDLVALHQEKAYFIAQWYLARPEALSTRKPNRTSFDYVLYQKIETILTSSFPHRQQQGAQDCCVVILDEQGDLITMNSCRSRDDQHSGKLNSCLAKRQVGSAMKPFLYVWAMELLGLVPDDTILDEEVTYQLDDGSLYTPKNFDLQTHGEVSLAMAL
ncbi:MAG: hypothetical protein H6765_03775 [Candidatus Peribacteria bacterium]|nr:MAG: hypothetical protein H6765_03775 [Candidatus Peribacteria bacterium]